MRAWERIVWQIAYQTKIYYINISESPSMKFHRRIAFVLELSGPAVPTMMMVLGFRLMMGTVKPESSKNECYSPRNIVYHYFC